MSDNKHTTYVRDLRLDLGVVKMPDGFVEIVDDLKQFAQISSINFRQFVNDDQDPFNLVESIEYNIRTYYPPKEDEVGYFGGQVIMECASQLDTDTLDAMNKEVDLQIERHLGDDIFTNLSSKDTFKVL